jgi:hypothetical protein
MEAVRDSSVDHVILRGKGIVCMMSEGPAVIVVDDVAGKVFPFMLKPLRRRW